MTANNASRLYGDPNPVFTGTITGILNGDNITATYASTTATATSAVGTYAIVPTLSDNGTGALANYTVVVNNGVLTVNKAPLTVSVANASRLYGAANPAFTGAITGLKNGDVITASYSTTATAASNVGTYPITPTLSDPAGVLPNYAVTTTNGTLTITPAPLTVTAANASRVYGDPNPVFTGAITGLLNGDNITATYSTTATPASAVETYPITPALVDPTGKLGNYTVTANNGLDYHSGSADRNRGQCDHALRWSDSDSDWHDHGNQERGQHHRHLQHHGHNDQSGGNISNRACPG